MKKFLMLIIGLTIYVLGKAQAINDSTPNYQQLVEYYQIASIEEKALLDSIFASVADTQRDQQVKQICGINFGIPISDARQILTKKFGEPMSTTSDSNQLSFNNVRYAGISFDNIHFLFQSDGWQTYFNTCVFVKGAKSKKEVEDILALYKEQLSKKYDISEAIGDLGFTEYGGGISPLWNGSPFEILDNTSAFHIDVIEYDSSIVDAFGKKYGVRIIYGPYNYVKEEF